MDDRKKSLKLLREYRESVETTLLVPDPLQTSRRLALLKGLCRSTNNEECLQLSSPLMVTRHLPVVSKSRIH